MDVLNIIWCSLIYENPNLVDILLIPLTFIESYFSMLIFTSILNLKIQKNKKLAYIVLSSVISIITNIFLPIPINVIINYIVLFVIIWHVLNYSIVKSFCVLILPIALYSLISSLILNPFLTLLNISYNQVQYTPIYRLFFIFCVYFLISIIVFIFKYKNIKLNIVFNELSKQNKILISFNFIIALILLFAQLIMSSFLIDKLPILYTIINCFALLAYFLISFFTLAKTTELALKTRELENAEEYNKSLQILHDGVRCFKHDFDNIVATIGGFVKTNDMEGLEKYYNSLETDCKKLNNLYILNPKIVNNPGIYNLLIRKYQKAEKRNVTINWNFFLDLETLKMPIYEFSRILGILLDNAIEAAAETKEKIINVDFRNEPNKKRQIISIQNTFKAKDLNIDKLFEKGFTSKENHSGLGLYEIKKILNKNNNTNLYTTKDSKYFNQQLELYYT